MNRQARAITTALVVGAVVSPALLDADGFPLSTYPMYSRVRAREVSFATAYGVDAADERHRLSLGTIGDSDDPLIVAGELRAAIRAGRAGDRCREVAGRAGDGTTELRSIEIVSELHDTVDLATGDRPSLIERTVHARCAIEEQP